jgi:predicted Rossmann fold flavoprotein
MMKSQYDSVIIGAGAAGLMCAMQVGSKGKKVLLLDHAQKLAEKIRISGGGKCNFTNTYTGPDNFISNNPHFCISALSRYTPNHFTELLSKYNISYHEKTLGQLFCDNSSEDIINLLDYLCESNNVIRKMDVNVEHIDKTLSGFKISSTIGQFNSETLVIATGGLSIPQIGASGFGYNIAKNFDLSIIDTKPALVPFALDPEQLKYFAPLSGNSFFSETATNVISFRENTLITHRGLSGPAILQISSYWDGKEAIIINMLPDLDIEELINESRNSNKLLPNFLSSFFSERLANKICIMLNIIKPLSQLTNKEVLEIKNFIHNFSIKPSGTLGYKKSEVTRGGVDTNELSSKTMMANKVEGLFFIGEVVM